MKNHEIDKLLDAVPMGDDRRGSCKVCRNEDLGQAIRRWLERRAEGEVLPPLQVMHDQLFSKMSEAGISTVRRHITTCLALDHKTGKPIDG